MLESVSVLLLEHTSKQEAMLELLVIGQVLVMANSMDLSPCVLL